MKLHFKEGDFPKHAKVRREGFADAVLKVARRDGDTIEVEAEDWQRLTWQYAPIPRSTFGLGDAVALVAQPIAGAIDWALGTHLSGCGGCGERKETLNRWVPSLNPLEIAKQGEQSQKTKQ
jgi:hypothetical protein